eukprot:167103_1
MIALILLSSLRLSLCQTWTGQRTVMDVPWTTNIYDTNVKIVGDATAISKINGNYIQNGPAIWQYMSEDDNLSVFLGLPMIRAFYFKNGKISFRARMINDSAYAMFYDENLNASIPFNESNIMEATSVTIRKINGNVLANGPSMRGNMIDAIDLTVLQSPYTYNDDVYINHERSDAPPHSQIDPNTNELFHMFLVTDLDFIPSYYQLYYIKPNTNKRIFAPNKVHINHEVDKYGYIQHMNGLTKHFYIFCAAPPMIQNLSHVIWTIVDRYSGEIIAEFTSDTFMYFHYPNSYEFIDEVTNQWYVISDIGISTLSFDEFKNASKIQNIFSDPYSLGVASKSMHINRFIFPLNRTGIHIEWTPLINITGQMMPVINYEQYNTMPYQYIYSIYTSIPNTPSDSLIKIKVPLITTHKEFIDFTEKWDVFSLTEPNYNIWKPDQFQNTVEPYFIPNDNGNNINEDDGFLIDVVLNGATNSSYLLMLNATTMEEIVRVYPNLDVTNGSLPIAFHARYYQTNS